MKLYYKGLEIIASIILIPKESSEKMPESLNATCNDKCHWLVPVCLFPPSFFSLCSSLSQKLTLYYCLYTSWLFLFTLSSYSFFCMFHWKLLKEKVIQCPKKGCFPQVVATFESWRLILLQVKPWSGNNQQYVSPQNKILIYPWQKEVWEIN